MAMMRADGIAPNVQTYGAAALAHGASGAWEASLQLLREMDTEGTAPTDVLLCNVLNACAMGGAWRPALMLVRGMHKRYGIQPDAACVNAGIKACAHGNQWKAALGLLQKLGDEATPRSHLSTLVALANSARWREALQVRYLPVHHGPPLTLDPLI